MNEPVNLSDKSWTNPPTLAALKKDYQSAKTSHDNVIAKIKEWRTILLAPDRNFGKNRSKITPKIVKKQAEWTYPVIEEPMLSAKDMFAFDPVTAEDPELAHNIHLILNHQMNKEINKIDFVTNSVRRYVDDGTLIVKIGWEKKETYKYEFEPKFSWVLERDVLKAQSMVAQGIPPYTRVQKGYKKVLNKKTIKNAPSLEVMDPAKVIIDPNAQGDLLKAQFIIEEFDTNLSNLKKAGIYKNLDVIENANLSTEIDDSSGSDTLDQSDRDTFSFSDKARKNITAIRYWGYWDFDGKGMTSPFVATWVNNTMIHIERNPTPYLGLPFETAQFKPVHKSNYGEPDAEIIKDNQEIIGAVTRGWIDIMGRSAAGQTARQKGFTDNINKIKMENGEDYEYNPGFDPRAGLYMHDFPELGQTPLTMIQMQEMDVESLTGRKAFSGGISGNAMGDSVGAIRTAMDASAKREMGILRRYSSMMERVALKMIAMNEVFLTDEQIIRITNSDYLINNRDKEAGKYDLKINIETPEQKQAKIERIAFLMQTTGNSLPFDFTQMQLEKMYELENMPDLAKKIKDYVPEPNPMDQLQQQLIQAQIQQISASAQEDMMDVQLKGAKTQETIAKTALLGSDKDMQDLEFQHKFDGVDINNDKQKHLMLEDKKTQRELTKERMKQQIVDSQLRINSMNQQANRDNDNHNKSLDRYSKILHKGK